MRTPKYKRLHRRHLQSVGDERSSTDLLRQSTVGTRSESCGEVRSLHSPNSSSKDAPSNTRLELVSLVLHGFRWVLYISVDYLLTTLLCQVPLQTRPPRDPVIYHLLHQQGNSLPSTLGLYVLSKGTSVSLSNPVSTSTSELTWVPRVKGQDRGAATLVPHRRNSLLTSLL